MRYQVTENGAVLETFTSKRELSHVVIGNFQDWRTKEWKRGILRKSATEAAALNGLQEFQGRPDLWKDCTVLAVTETGQ